MNHIWRVRIPTLHRWRRILCTGAASACLWTVFGVCVVRAEDVPFKYENVKETVEGVAQLQGGHLTANLPVSGGRVVISGEVSADKVTVTMSGAVGTGTNCANSALAVGEAPLAGADTVVRVTISGCWIEGDGVLHLKLPDVTSPTQNASEDSASAQIDPIDQTYVVVTAAKVREKPDALSSRVTTLPVGQKINVVGRLKGQNWYLVSQNDQPLGYVVVDDLLPESQMASTGPSSGGLSATGGTDSGPIDISKLDFGRYDALVIGNDSYRNGLPALKTAVVDAESVARILQSDYGFRVTVLTNATRAQILEALTQLRLSLKWDDNLLIYYAGHGSYDQAGEQGYWLPVDAQPQDPTNWVSNADITTMLKAIQARHIMVVADSCYSGSLTRDAATDIRDASYLARIVQKKARTVMTSGGLEPVADAGSAGHSVFAAAFLAALRANHGVMDAETFFEQVRKPVVLAASQTPEYTNLSAAGHEGGDFVFVRQ